MRTALLLFLLLLCRQTLACTIVTGIDRKGQTWAMNNEDFFHTASNYVNVYPATERNTLGYITLTYGSPTSGIQGGVNEAGVFVDINALPPQNYKLRRGRKPFPHGSMLVYLLQRCRSVPDFLALWETYYMPDMGDVQLHVADRQGNLAIVAPDTIVRSTKQLISTNFNVCETGPTKQNCWRYPVAQRLLTAEGVSRSSLVQVAQETSQREFITTVYTNIHNLTTGEVWFYLAEDYQSPWYTTVSALLKEGKRSLLLATKFPRNASGKLAKALQEKPSLDVVEDFLRTGKFNDLEKESVLRLTFLNDFYIEKHFTQASILFPVWEKYIRFNPKLDSTEVQFTKAEVLATQGHDQEAIHVLKSIEKPSWKTEALLRDLLNHESALVIGLSGFSKAQAVVVELKGEYNFFRFAQRTPQGWVLHLKTDRKELKYCFYVDGKRVLNPTQPILSQQETVKGDFAAFNLLKL